MKGNSLPSLINWNQDTLLAVSARNKRGNKKYIQTLPSLTNWNQDTLLAVSARNKKEYRKYIQTL